MRFSTDLHSIEMTSVVPNITKALLTIYLGRPVYISTRSRSRALTIYFFRITIILIVFWLPSVFVFDIVRGIAPWGRFAFAVWTHSQGAVAALVSLMKPDVKDAVLDFVCYRWRAKNVAATDESQGAAGFSYTMRQASTDFTNRQPRPEEAFPVGESVRNICVEDQESVDEPSMNLDTGNGSSEREHEDEREEAEEDGENDEDEEDGDDDE